MHRVCVLIRVYNRIEDLKYCVSVIRDTWKLYEYYIIVVSNGNANGFIVDEETKKQIDKIIEVENNAGHINGNSQLLLSGVPYIPNGCKYTIILEADTWLYGDNLNRKYINKLNDTGAVWASAQFFRYIPNLATDFAIVNSSFIKANDRIFSFVEPPPSPEYYVASFLKLRGAEFVYIKELMPINMPMYVKRFPFAPTGRFYTFLKGKMVSHHIEKLKGGMEEKKYYFNVAANQTYFKTTYKGSSNYFFVKVQIYFFYIVSCLLPFKSMVVKNNNAKKQMR